MKDFIPVKMGRIGICQVSIFPAAATKNLYTGLNAENNLRRFLPRAVARFLLNAI